MNSSDTSGIVLCENLKTVRSWSRKTNTTCFPSPDSHDRLLSASFSSKIWNRWEAGAAKQTLQTSLLPTHTTDVFPGYFRHRPLQKSGTNEKLGPQNKHNKLPFFRLTRQITFPDISGIVLFENLDTNFPSSDSHDRCLPRILPASSSSKIWNQWEAEATKQTLQTSLLPIHTADDFSGYFRHRPLWKSGTSEKLEPPNKHNKLPFFRLTR